MRALCVPYSQLVIGIILENIQSSAAEEELLVSGRHIEQFIKVGGLILGLLWATWHLLWPVFIGAELASRLERCLLVLLAIYVLWHAWLIFPCPAKLVWVQDGAVASCGAMQ